ncbi:MAG: hypothetical protein IJP99_10670 [Methanobrevibacter sp.]|nr:hypothetical protein [Methanobrevibacter sp.]MBR0059781.1 hypothetical protein [Methanobrevibacter sp.]
MAKYIYYTEGRGHHVMRNIKGKMVSYGYYLTEEDAQFVVDELKQFNWNKSYLKGIQRRMMKNATL